MDNQGRVAGRLRFTALMCWVFAAQGQMGEKPLEGNVGTPQSNLIIIPDDLNRCCLGSVFSCGFSYETPFFFDSYEFGD